MTNHGELQSATRRNFALGAGLAGLAIAGAGIRANAQTSTPNPDIALLNYALTLEHLEAAFYTQGLTRFTANDFASADFASVFGPGTVAGVYTNLGRIRDHEVAHVAALQAAIRTLGGTPVEPCTYNFRYNNAQEFLLVARTLEETGVMAYDGAIGLISAAALKAAGASIATVEARHASYLQLITNNIPFPQAFDQPKMMNEILAIAAPFLASCPTPPGGGTGSMTTTAVLLPKELTTVSSQVQLNGSQSTSANGQPLKYELRVISGSASVIQGDTATPSVQFVGGFGDYVFELVVTDSTGTVARDRVTVHYAGQ